MTIVPGNLLVLQLQGGAVSCSLGLSACVSLYRRPCSSVFSSDSIPFVSPGDLTAALEKKLGRLV